jgi:hypothetical protein
VRQPTRRRPPPSLRPPTRPARRTPPGPSASCPS